MARDTEHLQSAPTLRARVIAVIPVEDRGRHELLRLAAGLGEYLQPEFAAALTAAARSEDILPAHVEPVIVQDALQGVLARVEERHLALGRYGNLLQLGLVPKAAEVHVARRIAAAGNTALYLMVVEDGHCIGLIGIEMR
jgi:cation transport ATPase